jgi:hypothetical protein
LVASQLGCLDVSDVEDAPQLSQLSTAGALIVQPNPKQRIRRDKTVRMIHPNTRETQTFTSPIAFATGVRRSMSNRV